MRETPRPGTQLSAVGRSAQCARRDPPTRSPLDGPAAARAGSRGRGSRVRRRDDAPLRANVERSPDERECLLEGRASRTVAVRPAHPATASQKAPAPRPSSTDPYSSCRAMSTLRDHRGRASAGRASGKNRIRDSGQQSAMRANVSRNRDDRVVLDPDQFEAAPSGARTCSTSEVRSRRRPSPRPRTTGRVGGQASTREIRWLGSQIFFFKYTL